LKREPQWSEAIGVGSESFISAVKQQMKAMAIGRRLKSLNGVDRFELREAVSAYSPHFGPEKSNIGQATPGFGIKFTQL
jgi:hypothetical protein